jgi:chromosome segregation ATPase
MNKDVDRILHKLEKFEHRLDSIDIKQAYMNKDLEAHMARSARNEDMIQEIRKQGKAEREELLRKLEPLDEHLTFIRVLTKLILWVGGISGAVFAVYKLALLYKGN